MSPFSEADVARFWATVDKSEGCWTWKNSLAARGYGSFSSTAINRTSAHRVAFFLTRGRWPRVACHKCNNKACVRPDHIYDGDMHTNAMDCVFSGNHYNARKTECPRGHSFAHGGSVIVRNGAGGFKRVCVVCRRATDAKRRQNNRLRKGWAPREDAPEDAR